jgi:ribosome recycling factor
LLNYRLTTESREKLARLIKNNAEIARQRIRLVRQEGLKDLKKDVRGGLSVDDGNKLAKKVGRISSIDSSRGN